MKKIVVLALSVLVSTLSFAKGNEAPVRETSAVGVLSSLESNMVKVFYKAPRSGNVKVSILNDDKEILFSETVKKTDGFMRPYNFDALPIGKYTIQIEDAFGRQTEVLNYHSHKACQVVRLAKVAGQENKYVLTGRTSKEDNIRVRIYDERNKIVFEENRKVAGEFGEVYDVRKLIGSFTIEVAGSDGILTSLQY